MNEGNYKDGKPHGTHTDWFDKNQKCYEKTTPEMKKYAKKMVSDFKQYHKRMIQREKNRIPNSVRNNKMLWYFQETCHDIWNFDIPSPPMLTTINKYDIRIWGTKYIAKN